MKLIVLASSSHEYKSKNSCFNCCKISLLSIKKMQPLEVFNAPPGTGPNPWKVVIILEELNLPYNTTWIRYSDIKSEPYISLNPNGRIPSLRDPNTGVALFESGAIVEYLIETYDGLERRISYGQNNPQECWVLRSWLMFQMSGQGVL